MPITVGNAASPRWFEMTLTGLDRYIEFLLEFGATSTELVLHRGPFDDQIARVQILESDWRPTIERFTAAGIVCHVHAPLHPRFSLRRWRVDRAGLQSDLLPVLDETRDIADRQGSPCVFVIHGANDPGSNDDENASATREFAAWVLDAPSQNDDVRIAVELRAVPAAGQDRWDTTRAGLLRFVESFPSDRLGICWDLGHDWENRSRVDDWVPEPSAAFLHRVIHVHAHDAGEDGSVHVPLITGRVPIDAQVASLIDVGYSGAITMEIRYRNALAFGDPLEALKQSYRRMREMLGRRETR